MNQRIRNLETLQQLLALTEEMIKAALAEDLETVSELDKQRMALLVSQDGSVTADEQSQNHFSDLIQRADERLLAEISTRRERMATAGLQQRSRSTAVRGYREAQALQCSDY